MLEEDKGRFPVRQCTFLKLNTLKKLFFVRLLKNTTINFEVQSHESYRSTLSLFPLQLSWRLVPGSVDSQLHGLSG
jgi:hypothetical protein